MQNKNLNVWHELFVAFFRCLSCISRQRSCSVFCVRNAWNTRQRARSVCSVSAGWEPAKDAVFSCRIKHVAVPGCTLAKWSLVFLSFSPSPVVPRDTWRMFPHSTLGLHTAKKKARSCIEAGFPVYWEDHIYSMLRFMDKFMYECLLKKDSTESDMYCTYVKQKCCFTWIK